jgi:predicted nicotinamide N-methyase
VKDPEGFILANTKLLSPPLVPEIKLHLAEESLPIWQKTEEELGAINVPPPYWAFAWAGGQALARYLLDHASEIKDQHVVDLGSGSGLTALAAKHAGAAHVLAADIDALALSAIKLNAYANNLELQTTAQDLLAAAPGDFGVVLVGDLFYERQLAELVQKYIDQAKAQGAKILIGDPGRNYFPKDRFQLAAEYRVPVTRELEDAEIKKTSVWLL